MPVTLNNTNITINDGTNNFVLETVKTHVPEVDIDIDIVPAITNSEGDPAFELLTYTHSGGSENQTEFNLTINEDTKCDILIVGGGGGGGHNGGGGGGGDVLYFENVDISIGTYNIKVGKGGIKGTNPSSGGVEPTKGADSIFDSVTAEGGGANGGSALKDGGSGAGGDSWLNGLGTKSKGLKNTNVDTYSSGTVYSKGNDGGEGSIANGQGAGGGGAGAAGEDGASGNTSASPGNGGNGLSNINEINFDFKSNFGSLAGKLESDNLVYFAAGGGGGGWDISSPETNSVGGKGGGGAGGIGETATAGHPGNGGDGLFVFGAYYAGGGGGSGRNANSFTSGSLGGKGGGGNARSGSGTPNTGGGGGGSTYMGASGAGGSGIVILRYL